MVRRLLKLQYFFAFLIAFLVFLHVPSFVFAQTTIVEQSGPPLSVEIKGSSLQPGDRLFDTDIEIINNTDSFVGDLTYRLEFHHGDHLGHSGHIFSAVQFVTAAEGDLNSLEPNERRREKIFYELPRTIPDGNYFLRLIVNNADQSYYGIHYTKRPQFLSGVGGFIPFINAALITPQDGLPHLLMEGPILSKEDTPIVAILEKNNPELFAYLEQEEIYVSYDVYHITDQNTPVFSKEREPLGLMQNTFGDGLDIALAPWENLAAGAHTAKIVFEDVHGEKVAPSLTVRLLYSGLLGRIYEVDTGINKYRRGEPIDLEVNVVAAGNVIMQDLILQATLLNGDEVEQTIEKKVSLDSHTILGTDTSVDFSDVRAEKRMVIDAVALSLFDTEGNVLDTELIDLSSEEVFAYDDDGSALKTVGILILILVVLLIIIGFIRKKYLNIFVSLALAIVVVSGALYSVYTPERANAGHITGDPDVSTTFSRLAIDQTIELTTQEQQEGALITAWSNPTDSPSGYGGTCEGGCTQTEYYIKVQCKQCANQPIDFQVNFFNDWNHTATNFRTPSSLHDRQITLNTGGAEYLIDYGNYVTHAGSNLDALVRESRARDAAEESDRGELAQAPEALLSSSHDTNDSIDWWLWGPFVFDICWVDPDARLIAESANVTNIDKPAVDSRITYLEGLQQEYADETGESSVTIEAEKVNLEAVQFHLESEQAAIIDLEELVEDGYAESYARYTNSDGSRIEQYYNVQVKASFGGAGYCQVAYDGSGVGANFTGVLNSTRKLSCDIPGKVIGTFFLDEDEDGEYDFGETFVKGSSAPAFCPGLEGDPLARLTQQGVENGDDVGQITSSRCNDSSSRPIFSQYVAPGEYVIGADAVSGWEQTGVLLDPNGDGSSLTPAGLTTTINPGETTFVMIGINSNFPVVLSCNVTIEDGDDGDGDDDDQGDDDDDQGDDGDGGSDDDIEQDNPFDFPDGGSWAVSFGSGGSGSDDDDDPECNIPPSIEIIQKAHDLPVECLPNDPPECSGAEYPVEYHMIGISLRLHDPCYPQTLWSVSTYYYAKPFLDDNPYCANGSHCAGDTRKHGDEWDVSIDRHLTEANDGALDQQKKHHAITVTGWRMGEGPDADVRADGQIQLPDECECNTDTELICDDGLDNDNDEGEVGGGTDCDDDDCNGDPACSDDPGVELICDDDLDNDSDGETDCADADCEFDQACSQTEVICDDGIDNDSDNATDCADNDCAVDPVCAGGGAETQCADGIDNDSDNATDCADNDCALDPVCSGGGGGGGGAGGEDEETGDLCVDEEDNDLDGSVDCEDDECSLHAFCGGVETICDDGIDDDFDDNVDCADADCGSDPSCGF